MPLPTPQDAAPEMSGLVLRSFVKAVEGLGLKEAVLPRVPPDVATLIRSLPFPTSWFPLAHGERICDAVDAIAGPEATHQLGYRMVRDGMGPVLLPLLRALAAMFRNGPAELFARLDAIIGLNIRGMGFRYLPETERSGTVEMVTSRPLSGPAYVCWAGNLSFCFDVVGIAGKVTFEGQFPERGVGQFHTTW